MDPTELLCEIRNSFSRSPPEITSDLLPHPYSLPLNRRPVLEKNIVIAPTMCDRPDERICDIEKYHELFQMKSKYNDQDKEYLKARARTNPFEEIGRSIFMNRAAIKLANIDAVYNLTQHFGGLMKKHVDEIFTFCDIAAGPGGFTQYLQFRWPNSMGYGITLKDENDWNRSKLDLSRFSIFYGDDGTGDLYTNWQGFVTHVRTNEPDGVDLILGDGGFDIEREASKFEEAERPLTPTTRSFRYQCQEFLSSRLILCQILVALKVLRTGCTFVCKVFDTVTPISAQLLFLLACSFDSLSIFKPVSSRPANSERYLICQGLRENIEPYADLLAEANSAYTATHNVVSLFDTPLPEDFLKWLYQENMRSINRQLEAGELLLRYWNGENVSIPRYNLHKALIVWNLPDNRPSRRSRIKI